MQCRLERKNPEKLLRSSGKIEKRKGFMKMQKEKSYMGHYWQGLES